MALDYIIDEEYLISVRRHLHAHPELSLKEYETAQYIESQLDDIGISHKRMGETGVMGIIEGKKGKGKTVLLRADIDALPVSEANRVPYCSRNPGVMHACGHDAHTAALLGAAKALWPLRDQLFGRVFLVFQPAEEFGHGSRFFTEAAAMADQAFAIHVSPHLPAGTVGVCEGTAAGACDFFRIELEGKSAHITRPRQGIDALYMASLLSVDLQSMTNRILDPSEKGLIGIGKLTAGSAHNVIAHKAVLEGSIRSFTDEIQHKLKTEIKRLAEKTAAAHGGKAVVAYESFAPAVINNPADVQEFLKIAASVTEENKIAAGPEAGLGFGGDDFAVFLKAAGKGIYARIGTANEENRCTKEELHSSSFDIDEKALPVAAKMYTAYAVAVLAANRLDCTAERD